MSDNGDYIVGYLPDSESDFEPACYWDREGSIHLLGSLSSNGFINNAYDVSNSGIIIGTEIGYDNYDQYAFIWDAQNGIRDLKDVLINEFGYDFTGYSLTDAMYINPEGTYIIGNGYDPLGNSIVWEATIPEPTTLLLFGLGGLALRRRFSGN